MKAYIFYTDSIKDWIDLVIESTNNIDDLEVVPILGKTNSTSDLAGATHSHEYMKLMLSRWLSLPKIIKENIGNNILFLDCDIVFNEYKEDFVDKINLFLQDHDMVTQYDTNSGMSLGINMGFLGIKCSEKTFNFFSEFMNMISKIQNPNTGYPQIEFNNYLNYLKNYDSYNMVDFKVLPQDYGYLTENCYFYHAIGVPGNQGKINAMKSALSNFKKTHESSKKKLLSAKNILEGKVALVVNTISKNDDVWECFFDRIARYVPTDLFNKKYVFVDDDLSKVPKDYNVIRYDRSKTYKEQFCQCINKVEEEYCVYISEDYILYNNIDSQKIQNFIDLMNQDKEISFIRFMKGGVYNGPYQEYSKNLFYVPIKQDYFYTNQVALWRTRDLQEVHERGPNLHIANLDWQNSFEYQATKTCQEMLMKGLFCYYDERKRGMYHYDSSVFPHISTALVKGKWNMTEYPKKMSEVIREYDIDIQKRGWV